MWLIEVENQEIGSVDKKEFGLCQCTLHACTELHSTHFNVQFIRACQKYSFNFKKQKHRWNILKRLSLKSLLHQCNKEFGEEKFVS
jgi:hypothetical protein